MEKSPRSRALRLFPRQIQPGNCKASGGYVTRIFLDTDLIVIDSFEPNSVAFSEPLRSMISERDQIACGGT